MTKFFLQESPLKRGEKKLQFLSAKDHPNRKMKNLNCSRGSKNEEKKNILRHHWEKKGLHKKGLWKMKMKKNRNKNKMCFEETHLAEPIRRQLILMNMINNNTERILLILKIMWTYFWALNVFPLIFLLKFI